jgi:putative sigma-54 modulation protein
LEITVKGKNFDITEALRNHAKQKLSKTTRFSDAVITAEVILTLERNWHIAKITLNCKGSDLHAEEKSTDMYNSIDRVVEKLERELKKQKEKQDSHRGAKPVPTDAPIVADNAKRAKADKEEDPYSPRIGPVQRFVPQSMSLEEAIKELESAGEDFLGFLNDEDGRFQILRRKGKGFALLEPRLEG